MSQSTRNYDVKIWNIRNNADRFGQIRPLVSFDSVRPRWVISHTHMKSFSELETRNYAIGDRVALRLIGDQPQLGAIIKPADSDLRRPYEPNKTYCSRCQGYFTHERGRLFCSNVDCPGTVFGRLQYAAQPNVLDLPVGLDTLNYLHWGEELTPTFSSLFFLDPVIMAHTTYDEAETTTILEGLRVRIDQLFGIGYAESVQKMAQRRFLDALSIDGIDRIGLRVLCDKLHRGSWVWGDLPSVLSDKRTLLGYGIAKQEVLRIAAHSVARIEELDMISREF